MRLTKRGRVLAWTLLFATAFAIGVLTGPFAIDYSGTPTVVDTRDLTRNIDHP